MPLRRSETWFQNQESVMGPKNEYTRQEFENDRFGILKVSVPK